MLFIWGKVSPCTFKELDNILSPCWVINCCIFKAHMHNFFFFTFHVQVSTCTNVVFIAGETPHVDNTPHLHIRDFLHLQLYTCTRVGTRTSNRKDQRDVWVWWFELRLGDIHCSVHLAKDERCVAFYIY